MAVAWLASRPVARWHLLACGAAVVLALNPLDLFNPGFQLSFAAVWAIFAVAPRLQGWLGSAVAVSVACTLVTTPIAWWHFGRLAPLSVPANLLALPAVGPVARMRAVRGPARLRLAAAGDAAADAGRPAGGLPAVGGAAVFVEPIGHLSGARWARACNPGPHSPVAATACAHRWRRLRKSVGESIEHQH